VRSPGEKLLAKYLADRGRSFTYEQALEGRHPDFRVTYQHADVICEVVDPEPNPGPKMDADEHWRVGAGPDPHPAIRALINRKKRQGRGAKGLLPYVLVDRPRHSRFSLTTRTL
jgi:hypothetical protein